jgi:hypothetical protein
MEEANEQPTKILDVCFAYWKSKILFTANEFDLFSILSTKPLSHAEIATQLSVKSERGLLDLLDALVSMQLLQREGNGVMCQKLP